MPSYKNRITDTSEIKNDVNGFDLVECYKQGIGKLYLCFPNLGAGMIGLTAAAKDPDTMCIKTDNDYKYIPSDIEDAEDYESGKEIRFTPYSGMSREMFVTTIDTVTGCGNSASLGNTLKVCIPWKIYSVSDATGYMNSAEASVLTNDLKIIGSDESIIRYDYYVTMMKIAHDVITGTSGKTEELMDGIAASIIRYASAGMDFLLEETDEEGNITSQYPPETKWAKPYNVAIENYNPVTERAEYTDLFTDERDYNQYLTKIADGRTEVNIQDIFAVPCVLYGIEGGSTNRLFYSKELSDMIIDNINIEGYSTPPLVEFSRVLNVYGYEGGDSPLYMSKHNIDEVEDDLGIAISELDALTGSGYDIKERMKDLCADIPSIRILDWSAGHEYTGDLIEHGITLTTPRPPVFSIGEVYTDPEEIQETTDKLLGRLPFYYSYIVPSLDSGYLQQQYLKETDFLGFRYWHSEGYDNLIKATRGYLSILKKNEELVLMQAPARYPVSWSHADTMTNTSSWRMYTGTFATVTTGFVSGKPSGPNFTDNIFIAEINNGDLPTIEKVRDVEPVQKPDDLTFRPQEPIPPEKPMEPAAPVYPQLTMPTEPEEPVEGPNHDKYMDEMKRYDEAMLDYIVAKSNYDEAYNEYAAQMIIYQQAYNEWVLAMEDWELAVTVYNQEMAEYEEAIAEAETMSKQYEQDLAAYVAYETKIGGARSSSDKYEAMMYQYLGPCSHVDYDYTMYPVMVSDSPARIKAQDDPETVTTKPDKGAVLYKTKNESYRSMSADPSFVDIPGSGAISIEKMFKSASAEGFHKDFLPNIPKLVSGARSIIADTNSFLNEYILDLDNGLAIDTEKIYPIFTNNECCLTEAIQKPYIGNTLKKNLMYLSGDISQDDTIPVMMGKLVDIWSTSSGSLVNKLVDQSSARRGVIIKGYADQVRTGVIEPTRMYCDKICSKLMKKEGNNYLAYFLNQKGTIANTESFKDKYGYVVITPDTQSLGCWFYNTRKIYLLMMSLLSLVESMADGLDNYMVALMNDNSPKVLDMDPQDGEPITAEFHSFAFMNGSNPVYPKLNTDIEIADLVTPYLNCVTPVCNTPEKLIYDITIDLEEMSSSDDVAAVVMPGFGIRNHTYVNDDKHKFFWPDDSIYIITDDPDQETLNAKFTNLQNGISHDDFVTIENGNLSFIDGSTGMPVQVTPTVIESAIKSTKQEIPEIPTITVKGVIDAGFIMPFYDKGKSLKATMESADVTYEGMNPVAIETSVDLSQFNGDNQTVIFALNEEIDRLISMAQYDPRPEYKKGRRVFKEPYKVEENLKKIVDKMDTMVLSASKLVPFLAPGNTDADINISVISHSFVRSGAGHTNNVTQGYLFDTDHADMAPILDPTSMANEIKGTGLWESYTTAGTDKKHMRNFNVYLSKRRSHYTSHVLLMMLLRGRVANNSAGSVTATSDSFSTEIEGKYRVTIKIADTKPAGTSFKLFSSYGMAGFFFDINLKNNASSTTTDIDNTIRSQVRLSNSLAKADYMSFTGYEHEGCENDRIKYDIRKTGVSSWLAPFPNASLLFPMNCAYLTKKGSKQNAVIKETYRKNEVELPVNYSSNAVPQSGLYDPGNIAKAHGLAQTFVNAHIDSFMIDSFINKVWVIIEEL